MRARAAGAGDVARDGRVLGGGGAKRGPGGWRAPSGCGRHVSRTSGRTWLVVEGGGRRRGVRRVDAGAERGARGHDAGRARDGGADSGRRSARSGGSSARRAIRSPRCMPTSRPTTPSTARSSTPTARGSATTQVEHVGRRGGGGADGACSTRRGRSRRAAGRGRASRARGRGRDGWRWWLEAAPRPSAPSHEEPDLRLDARALAAIAFGGLPASHAARLGWAVPRDPLRSRSPTRSSRCRRTSRPILSRTAATFPRAAMSASAAAARRGPPKTADRPSSGSGRRSAWAPPRRSPARCRPRCASRRWPTAGASAPRAWVALAAAALVPMVAAVVVLRGAREGLRAFAGPGAGLRAFGVGLWIASLIVAFTFFGGVLRAHTHHHGLAGVTFAFGALGLAIAIGPRLRAHRLSRARRRRTSPGAASCSSSARPPCSRSRSWGCASCAARRSTRRRTARPARWSTSWRSRSPRSSPRGRRSRGAGRLRCVGPPIAVVVAAVGVATCASRRFARPSASGLPPTPRWSISCPPTEGLSAGLRPAPLANHSHR